MKRILFVLLTLIIFTSCHNFEKEAKPVYKDLKELFMAASTKCQAIEIVWRTAIFDKKYYYKNTYITDFSQAIAKMEEEEQPIKDLNIKILSLKKTIGENIVKVKDKSDASYDKLMSLYTNLISLSSLAITPEGNLQSYSNEVSNLNSEIRKLIVEIEVRNPDIIK